MIIKNRKFDKSKLIKGIFPETLIIRSSMPKLENGETKVLELKSISSYFFPLTRDFVTSKDLILWKKYEKLWLPQEILDFTSEFSQIELLISNNGKHCVIGGSSFYGNIVEILRKELLPISIELRDVFLSYKEMNFNEDFENDLKKYVDKVLFTFDKKKYYEEYSSSFQFLAKWAEELVKFHKLDKKNNNHFIFEKLMDHWSLLYKSSTFDLYSKEMWFDHLVPACSAFYKLNLKKISEELEPLHEINLVDEKPMSKDLEWQILPNYEIAKNEYLIESIVFYSDMKEKNMHHFILEVKTRILYDEGFSALMSFSHNNRVEYFLVRRKQKLPLGEHVMEKIKDDLSQVLQSELFWKLKLGHIKNSSSVLTHGDKFSFFARNLGVHIDTKIESLLSIEKSAKKLGLNSDSSSSTEFPVHFCTIDRNQSYWSHFLGECSKKLWSFYY